jgi:hypothetical protein
MSASFMAECLDMQNIDRDLVRKNRIISELLSRNKFLENSNKSQQIFELTFQLRSALLAEIFSSATEKFLAILLLKRIERFQSGEESAAEDSHLSEAVSLLQRNLVHCC